VLFSGNNQAIVNSVVTLPSPSISLVNNILCYGAGTGELMVTSADPNYTYIWEDLSDPTFNSSSAIVSNLFAGNYIVTVQYTDSLGQLLTGCNVSSDTLILLDGAEIFTTETLHTDVLCHGDNTGVLSVLASGGSGANYTYTWNPSQLTSTTIVNLLRNELIKSFSRQDHEFVITVTAGSVVDKVILIEFAFTDPTF
jgi:hypothetical protein